MPSPLPDYYAVLGVHAGADNEELRKAWRRLAARWHPDRAGEGATARFQQLSAAYTVLCDPVARTAYDRRRRLAEPKSSSSARSAATTSATPRSARPSVPAVMLSRLTGNLSSLLARGAAEFDEAGFITLAVSAAEAAQGGMARVSLHVDLWCPDCAAKEQSEGCARCGGSRKVEELFSAWLALRPGVAAGEVLTPSAELANMVEPIRFRVRLREAK